MAIRIKQGWRVTSLFSMLAFAVALMVVAPAAHAQTASTMLGGPKGVVKSSKGDLLEGMMVQLIAQKNAIRTTVYSNADGRYEFPKLDAGTYTLRIAQPREFHPFVKEKVEISGADGARRHRAHAHHDRPSCCRITPEIAAQMTGSEWLMSLSGTGEEKKLLTVNCNWCHSYQQIFRNHYDEKGWGHIVYRMTHGAGSPLINMRPTGRFNAEQESKFAKWLATVRGPDSKDPPFVTLPRPQGRQTRGSSSPNTNCRGSSSATHDVAGRFPRATSGTARTAAPMSAGSIRRPARSRNSVPPVADGVLPGTHWIYVDKNDIVWGSENWAHNIWRLDPKTEQFKRIPWKVKEPPNSPMGGNYAFDPKASSGRRATRPQQGRRQHRRSGHELSDQEIRRHLRQRHEQGRPLFRRRRLAARRRGRGRHQDRRSVRARHQPEFRAGARRVRSAGTITGPPAAAACW